MGASQSSSSLSRESEGEEENRRSDRPETRQTLPNQALPSRSDPFRDSSGTFSSSGTNSSGRNSEIHLFWDPHTDSISSPIPRTERLPEYDSPSASARGAQTTTNTRRPTPDSSRSLFSMDHNSVMALMFQQKQQQQQESQQSADEEAKEVLASVPVSDFIPHISSNNEWMGRSIETLLLGHTLQNPMLALENKQGTDEDMDDMDDDISAMSISTRDDSRRGYPEAPFALLHRSSLELYRRSSGDTFQDSQRTTLPDFPSRYRTRINIRRRSSSGSLLSASSATASGPNIALSVLAREITGRPATLPSVAPSQRLRKMGGRTLYQLLDRPSAGILSDVSQLEDALDRGDWTNVQATVTRLAPRLVGDPSLAARMNQGQPAINDPSLPPNTSQYYAGGGRLGLERDAFVLGGGVELLLRVFRDPAIVGEDILQSNDARDLTPTMVTNKLSMCWNEVLASLRELVFALPVLVESGRILEDGDFLPFLFTLLAHDSCFDGAAALIEEILSLQSHTPPNNQSPEDEAPIDTEYRAMGHVSPVSTFFLGNVPDLYDLWQGFSCRQLAHFCRILALLVFEPEDRQLLESPAVLKSLELLQLRRDRAARAGRDATVDMNQAILLGDKVLMKRLLKLLKIMNFAPTLKRTSAYHVMAHFPFIGETLVMLGLSEMDDWDDVERLEQLAKKLLDSEEGEGRNLSELGTVAEMLESLSGLLLGNPFEPNTQLGHIIHVINAAQQAGVVVGRQRTGRRRRNQDAAQQPSVHVATIPVDSAPSLDNLASAAMTLTDQVMMRRSLLPGVQQDGDGNTAVQLVGIGMQGGGPNIEPTVHQLHASRMRINTPEDAANELQFNALALAPYQVEVLFVLCTLLGGRRKIDAQHFLDENGLISTLDDMFHRLSWGPSSYASARRPSNSSTDGETSISGRSVDGNESSQAPEASQQQQQQQQPQEHGIHGPGCECTPESALSVQYLRLLHNFCDRDCDNYSGRRLLLSNEEREYVFSQRNWLDAPHERPILKQGLFSKVVAAFMNESDDSPYRFWLASCAESYLRGSSAHEQLFAAKTGLLPHLVADIISDRLHCAGSLQTSFDLLGELCKGNSEALHILVSSLDEESFRKLMSAAAANLVDSNVFLRSLLLSVERISAAKLFGSEQSTDPPANPWKNHRFGPWTGESGLQSRYYLTHSWWDAVASTVKGLDTQHRELAGVCNDERQCDAVRSSDWFPVQWHVVKESSLGGLASREEPDAFESTVGYNGWQFYPESMPLPTPQDPFAWAMNDAAFSPNTVERLTWFLITNQSRLLRDLLGVVDLGNINHENICCLNTAVVVAMFASRRLQLPGVLSELKKLSDQESAAARQRKRELQRSSFGKKTKDLNNSMVFLEMEDSRSRIFRPGMLRRLPSNISDRNDVLRNFRELLWFWTEYYTHRGRDRLSLEFSSHLRFHEWYKVVSLLTADDGSTTALSRRSIRLPKSPYHRAARIIDGSRRWE